jgi:hypothetical protein
MVGIGGDIIGKAMQYLYFLCGEVVVVGDKIIAYMYIPASRDVAVNNIFLMRRFWHLIKLWK